MRKWWAVLRIHSKSGEVEGVRAFTAPNPTVLDGCFQVALFELACDGPAAVGEEYRRRYPLTAHWWRAPIDPDEESP